LYYFTEYLRLGNLKNRNLFPQFLQAGKSKIKTLASERTFLCHTWQKASHGGKAKRKGEGEEATINLFKGH
jgi:hypothetical protein